MKSNFVGTYRIYLLYSGMLFPNYPGLGCYIGYTGSSIEQRVKEHLSEAKYSKEKGKKLNWLRRRCKELINYFILEGNIKTLQEAYEREKYHIAKFKTTSIGNYLKNGDDGGNSHITSTSVIENRLNKVKGNKWNVGRKVSELTRQRQRLSNRHIKHSKDVIEKMISKRKENYHIKEKQGIYRKTIERTLTEKQVIEIFRLFTKEYKSRAFISKQFNYSEGMLSGVLHNKNTYKDYKIKNNLIPYREMSIKEYNKIQKEIAIQYQKQFEQKP